MYKWLLVLVMVIALPTQAQGFVLEKQAVVDRVDGKKSVRRMYLMDGDVVVREYRIALGKSPRGHKLQEGDNRTPEGKYYLDFVMDDSAFYRSMHISYPNLRDKNRAESLGVSPGGNIKIHGLKNGDRRAAQFIQSFDWTNGCIAITNEEMDELVSLVKIGTPIYIRW
jgi:murein L,D-transpeptidase YafK